jgi:hypothetical protein
MAAPVLLGLTILMLGDSHFASNGYLVTTLQDQLISQGAKVTTYAACGAATGVWVSNGVAPCGTAERVQSGPLVAHPGPAQVPPFDAMVAQVHPNLVIIGGGDVMGGYAQGGFSPEYVGAQVNALIRRIEVQNIPCVWVGPGWGTEGGPYFKTFAKAAAINEFLATHVTYCHYIDSTKLAQPGEWPTFDGQHYTAVGYKKWGAAIDAAILRLAQGKP